MPTDFSVSASHSARITLASELSADSPPHLLNLRDFRKVLAHPYEEVRQKHY